MFIGKVTGALVTTQKEPSMAEAKLLVVEAYSGSGPDAKKLKATGKVLIAIDFLGAGTDEYVLVTQGSSARLTAYTKTMPVDAVVIGIVDSLRVGTEVMSAADGSFVE